MSHFTKLEALTEPEPAELKLFDNQDYAWFSPQGSPGSYSGTLIYDTQGSLNQGWIDLGDSFIWVQYQLTGTVAAASGVAGFLCPKDNLPAQFFTQVQIGLGSDASNLTSNVQGVNWWLNAKQQFEMSKLAIDSFGSWVGVAPDNIQAGLNQQALSVANVFTTNSNNIVTNPIISTYTAGPPVVVASTCSGNDEVDFKTGIVTPPTLNEGARTRTFWMGGGGKLYPAYARYAAPMWNGAVNPTLLNSVTLNGTTGTWTYNILVPLHYACSAFKNIDVMQGMRIWFQGNYPRVNGAGIAASGIQGSGTGICAPFMITNLGDGTGAGSTAVSALVGDILQSRLYVRKVTPTPQLLKSVLPRREFFYPDCQIFPFLNQSVGQVSLQINGVYNTKAMYIQQFASAVGCPGGISPQLSWLCTEPSTSTPGVGIGNVQVYVGDKNISQNVVTYMFEQFAFFQKPNLLNECEDDVIASGKGDQWLKMLQNGLYKIDLLKTRATAEDLKVSNFRISCNLYGPTPTQDVYIYCETESALELTGTSCKKLM